MVFKKDETGFTLIELLIVIAIMGILVAGAIPNLLRARMTANEAGAIGACKTIAAAQTDYNNNTNPHTYATDLTALKSGFMAGGVSYIDDKLANGLKSGYIFKVEAGARVVFPHEVYPSYQAWSASAWPIVYGSTGIRSFYIDESGIIRGSDIGGIPGQITLPALD